MRVCLASSKFIELQYLSLPLTMFIKNWSTSCTSSCSPNGVLNSLGKSPVAAHFHRYFSTHLGGRSRPHQFATLLCQLISNPKAIPDLRRIPTRLSTLISSIFIMKDMSSTYWLIISWDLHCGRITPLMLPTPIACLIVDKCLSHYNEQIGGQMTTLANSFMKFERFCHLVVDMNRDRCITKQHSNHFDKGA